MSEINVTIEEVKNVIKHPNADRLDIITVLGWNCVVTKDSLKVGDKVVYFPIDSVLPQDIENLIFGTDSKVKLRNSRVKTIKLRGAISQGLAVPLKLFDGILSQTHSEIGKNVTKNLGVTKFEMNTVSPFLNGKQTAKNQTNLNFVKYTDIQHGKNYPNVLIDREVVITEKLHGSNFRAGYVPIYAKNPIKYMWKYLKSIFIGKYKGYEFVFGSHNVQLQEKTKFNKKLKNSKFENSTIGYENFTNIYEKICEKYDLKKVLNKDVVIYGEIYGNGVQKNYSYGLSDIDMCVIDIKVRNRYIDHNDVYLSCIKYGLLPAPVLYKGIFAEKLINKFISGPSVLCDKQKIREGFVVKSLIESKSYMGREIFKYLNPDYLLLKNNTEWH